MAQRRPFLPTKCVGNFAKNVARTRKLRQLLDIMDANPDDLEFRYWCGGEILREAQALTSDLAAAEAEKIYPINVETRLYDRRGNLHVVLGELKAGIDWVKTAK